jgi:hypothetical protein
MKTNIIVIDNLRYPTFYEAQHAIPRIKIPKGYTLKGGERKYIIMGHAEESVIVIGPMTIHVENYSHEDIIRSVQENFEKLTASGGGVLSFECGYEYQRVILNNECIRNFGDAAFILKRDYGKAIQKKFGIPVTLEWIRGY